jgi:hypothetical protein
VVVVVLDVVVVGDSVVVVEDVVVDVELVDDDVVDEVLVDEDVLDEVLVDEELVDEDVLDEELVDGELVDVDVLDEELVDEELVDEDVLDEELVGGELVDEDVLVEEVLVVVGGGVPEPLRAIVTVPPGLAVNWSCAVAVPVAVGVKLTVTEQVAPAASEMPVQKLPNAVNCVAFVPVIVAAPIGPVGEPPVLVTMNANDSFVVPTATEPKL